MAAFQKAEVSSDWRRSRKSGNAEPWPSETNQCRRAQPCCPGQVLHQDANGQQETRDDTQPSDQPNEASQQQRRNDHEDSGDRSQIGPVPKLIEPRFDESPDVIRHTGKTDQTYDQRCHNRHGHDQQQWDADDRDSEYDDCENENGHEQDFGEQPDRPRFQRLGSRCYERQQPVIAGSFNLGNGGRRNRRPLSPFRDMRTSRCKRPFSSSAFFQFSWSRLRSSI